MTPPTIAIVTYNGVVRAEAEAFETVFSAVPGAHVELVGADIGVVAGAGGSLSASARFGDVMPDVVAVPGGLGSHRHLDIAAWVEAVSPQLVVASSTGTAMLAAGGLLTGRRVATHWLAGALVESFGAIVVDERVVVDGRFITCRGPVSAADAALLAVETLFGEAVADATRAGMESRAASPVRCERTRRRWPRRRRSTSPRGTLPTP
jgi:transcriptional regulator GlxA family with amidase domain